jgi:hypothetical protein
VGVCQTASPMLARFEGISGSIILRKKSKENRRNKSKLLPTLFLNSPNVMANRAYQRSFNNKIKNSSYARIYFKRYTRIGTARIEPHINKT